MSLRVALAILLSSGLCWAKPLPRDQTTISRGIAEELKLVPRTSPYSLAGALPDALPASVEQALFRYHADYDSLAELKRHVAHEPARFHLREATLKAIAALRDSDVVRIVEHWPITLPGPEEKARIHTDQKGLAFLLFALEKMLTELEDAGKSRANEKSPRWQAHYDYVRCACLARLVFLSEYSYALGRVRTANLPEPPSGSVAWRLTAAKDVTLFESKLKGWQRDLDKSLAKIVAEHPNTPWAILAQQERASPRGLKFTAK